VNYPFNIIVKPCTPAGQVMDKCVGERTTLPDECHAMGMLWQIMKG